MAVFYTNIKADIGYFSKSSKLHSSDDFFKNYKSTVIDHFITILYDNSKKVIDIKGINDDKAYKLVSILLDSYPLKQTTKIPIDIYIYKRKVYPDLDSVVLTKVQGYEDALKFMDTEQ